MNTARPYRSPVRQQQAERTRALVADAARARFLDKGWSGTSVRSVAELAGVSEATVYAVYGSKAGLASSLIDAAEVRADVGRAIDELSKHQGDASAQLRAFVGFDRRLFEVGGDVLRILAEARRHQPELGAAYREGRSRGEAQRRRIFSSWPEAAWRPELDVNHALAVYAMTVSLESYDVATGEHGWSPDEVEQWWHSTLAELFLSAPGS